MAADFQRVEVVFKGLDQKTDAKVTTPGTLTDARNVVFDKAGRLDKRRGFTRIDLDNEVQGNTTDLVFFNVTTYRESLVLHGAEHVYAVADRDSQINGTDALVERGPCLRGQFSIQHVVSSPHGQEV